MSKIVCNVHPEETISNFCCLRHCLKPLCPDCIDLHIKEHADIGELATVETLNRLKGKCSQLLTNMCKSFEEDITLLNTETGINFEEIASKSLDELKKFKTKLIDQINLYFLNLEKDFTEKIHQVSKETPDSKELKTKLMSINEHLKALKGNLETSEIFEAIKSSVNLNAMGMLEIYHQSVDEAITRSVSLPISFTYNENFSNIIEDLKKLVTITTKNVNVVTNFKFLKQMREKSDDSQVKMAVDYFQTKFK